MKRMVIQYPDGSNHDVTVTSARRCVNLATGNIDIVIEYKDHSSGIDECYTPIMNVLGKWYKNPNHGEWGDYLFYEKNEEDIIRELPLNMKSYNEAIYRENKEDKLIKHHVSDVMDKIIDMIKSKNPELLKRPRISNLLHRLGEMLMKAYNRFFNDNGQHFEWNISFMMRWNLFENIFNSLDSEEALARALDRAISSYEPLTRGYYSIRSRNEEISRIVRELRIMELYVPSANFHNVMLNLRDLNIMQMDSTMFESFIKEIKDVLNRCNVFTGDWTPEKMSQMEKDILQIIWKYQELISKRLVAVGKQSTPVKAFAFETLSPPAEKITKTVTECYKFHEKRLVKVPMPKFYRKNYVAVYSPAITGYGLPFRIQNFDKAEYSRTNPCEISYTRNNDVFLDRTTVIHYLASFDDAKSILPLYVEGRDGVVDIYYFGICDTEEKYKNIAASNWVSVYTPEDKPFGDQAVSFACGMEGVYPVLTATGKYFDSSEVNNVKNRNSGRR